MATRSQHLPDAVDDLDGGVRLDLREQRMADARGVEDLSDPLGDGGPEQPPVGDEERVCDTGLAQQVGELEERVRAVDDGRRQRVARRSERVAWAGLGGVDGDDLSPVVAMPWMRYRWEAMKNPNTGPMASTDIANSGPNEEVPVASRNWRSPRATVKFSGLVR